MSDTREPTLDLPSRLLGGTVAKRVYCGSLSELFLDNRRRLNALEEMFKRE